MKRFIIYGILLFFISISTAWLAGAAMLVQDSKHNLSFSGPGTIKASSSGASQICVFCHTPHSARADAPLWNRTNSTATYNIYQSDVLTALSYPSPEDPSSVAQQGYSVHVKTRICLSCHDGTIALGNLVNLPYSFTSNIPMQGTAGTTDTPYAMPHESAGYIGLDLRDDHPVAVKYLGVSGDPELNSSITGNVRVYDTTTGGKSTSAGPNVYVECTSCHNAHDNTNGNFLVDPNDGSKLCLSCHAKKIGTSTGSAHDTATTTGYAPISDGKQLGNYVSDIKCMTCHFPHKAGVTSTSPAAPNPSSGKYLLSFQEEASCFNYNPSNLTQTDRWNTAGAGGACHSSLTFGSRRDIQDLTGGGGAGGKTYGHHVGNYTDVHSPTEDRNTTKPGNANTNWANTAGLGWHVECQDCHNSHTAGSLDHVAPTNAVPTPPNDSPLYGAGGESVTAVPAWPNGAGSYSYIEPLGLLTAGNTVQYEYQVCFKCHSDFAWGASPPFSSTLGANMTNQAMEFGSGRASYHPVMQATGRTRGKLINTYYTWGAIGTNTMYCSDCHTKEGYGVPKGPHGSNNPFILGNSFQDQYGPRGGGDAQKQPLDLCFDCHDQNEYRTSTVNGQLAAGTGFYQSGTNVNLHTQHAYRAVTPITAGLNPFPYRCVNCHTRIPHGNNNKAMVVLSTDPAQYRPGAGMISVFSPQSTGYVEGNCTTVGGCHTP